MEGREGETKDTEGVASTCEEAGAPAAGASVAGPDPEVEALVKWIEDFVGFPTARPGPQPAQLTDWGLFLGGMEEATDVSRLAELGISATLNVAPSMCGSLTELYGGTLECKEIDAEDDEEYPILDLHLDAAVRFLKGIREQGRRVLVHCYAGMNRSATLCAAYLVSVERLPLTQAVRVLRERRGAVLQNRAFTRQLVRLARSEGLGS
mmetsp:Transcript_31935/g.99352  ORF Transcript_31935/g.99352 Transcript_31935/m.99352 type:complete len:208 (+) Transcript_31935:40-663(+)